MNNKYYKLSIVIFVVAALGFASFLFLKNSFSYSDVDLGWHLRMGYDYLLSGQAAYINYYNYTLFGSLWVDHEWLLNAVMAIIFQVGGFLSLHLFFFLVLVFCAFFVWRRSSELLGGDLSSKIAVFFWLFWGLLASRPHLGVRVQEFGLLGFSLIFLLFSNYNRYKFYFWLLPFLFFLWANIHGSFVLGLFLLIAYNFYVFLSPVLRRFISICAWRWDNFEPFAKWQILIVLVLSLLATLINPYGFGLYSFLGTYFNTAYMVYIREWQGQFVFPLFYAQIFYLSISLVSIFLLVRKKSPINYPLSWWEFFLFFLFFILAFRSRRHFPIFVFVSLPFLAYAFKDFFDQLIIWFNYKKRILFIISLSFLFLSLLIYQIFNIPWSQNSFQDFCGRKYPCAAVAYLQARPELENKRLFNEYDWGGYLLWAYPQRLIFIDGRMPQAQYKGHTILEEYLQFRYGDGAVSGLLNDYQIDLILLKNKNKPLSLKKIEKIFFNINNDELLSKDVLKKYLEESADWLLVFQDEFSVIYQRR